ncbi:MAG: thioredoxin family protein [Candidatus Hodarchaeales archaeon]|jgi:small redox-active disulfide protein 2
MIDVKIDFVVYGPGCAKCHKLESNVKEVIKSLGLTEGSYSLKKVTDHDEMLENDVLITPALTINGKLLLHGKLGTKKAIFEHVTKLIE